MILREYQNDCRERIRKSYAIGRRAPILQLPTGAGKTVIFSDITQRTAARGNSVYIGVHRQELIRQASNKLSACGVTHGIISPGTARTPHPVQVASIWTLCRRLDSVAAPALFIIDECHHCNAESWRKIIDAWPQTRLLGVTATPTRLDGSGLGVPVGYFDDLVCGPSVKDLVAMGYLTQSICYGPKTQIDFSDIKTVAGDFDKHEISVAMDKPKITGCAIEHYKNICTGTPFIAFCTNVAHAENVALKFSNAGIPCMSIDGKMDNNKRKYVLDCYASGKILGLSSCDLISEGFDVPNCGCTILLRPTKSESLFLQQPGRGMRPYPGRKYNYVLDHVGNCQRHGLPYADRNWTIEGSRRKKNKKGDQDAPKVRQCNKCFRWYDVSMNTCPGCGTLYIPKKKELEQVDGTLKMLSESDMPQKKKRYTSEEGRDLRDLIIDTKNRGLPMSYAFRIFHKRKREAEAAA